MHSFKFIQDSKKSLGVKCCELDGNTLQCQKFNLVLEAGGIPTLTVTMSVSKVDIDIDGERFIIDKTKQEKDLSEDVELKIE